VIATGLLLAAFAVGLTGYGFGLIAMGILPYVVTVTDANGLVAVLGLVVTLTSLVPRIRQVRLRVLLPLLVGALAGVPLGVLVLVRLDERLLRALLGAVILVALAGSLHGSWRAKRAIADGAGDPADAPDTAADAGDRAAAADADGAPGRPPATRRGHRRRGARGVIAALVGLVSGSFGGAFSVSGPPVVIYFNEVFSEKTVIKVHLVAYFTFVLAIRIPYMVAAGVYDGALLMTAAVGLPTVLLGLWLGARLHDRLPSETVRRIIQVLLAVSATLLIVGA